MPRLLRYALLTGGPALTIWFLTRWFVASNVHTGGSRTTPLNFEPLAYGLEVDLTGLSLGLVLGIGIAWLYARYLEGL